MKILNKNNSLIPNQDHWGNLLQELLMLEHLQSNQPQFTIKLWIHLLQEEAQIELEEFKTNKLFIKLTVSQLI